MSDMVNYKSSEAARILGVSVRTLQRWDIDGHLVAYRTPTNRRFYTQGQLDEYLKQTTSKSNRGNDMFESIVEQLCTTYHPTKIILFGSQSKGTATSNSDIDLCVVMNSDNKRRTLADLYFKIDSDKPIDFLLYTPSEWKECIADSGSFAYKIDCEGVVLHG